MFDSVLIANRGEIACRIARTARQLGMRTIAVYSDVDAGAPHTLMCDEVYPIGPAPAVQSYLVIEKLIDIARSAKAACVHPGYGFLSERAEFAEACAAAGIVFVGPPAAAIRAMGLKDRAKALMDKAGVPVVPGYHGERQDPVFLRQKAYEMGYPVLIKAVAGGGGKGMRRVDKHAEFEAALEGAMREAQSAFGDARVLIEKYVASPRHIEVQVFADFHGNVVHLFERDCTLQRRHQKVIEEAPAFGMTEQVREQVTRHAVEAARAVGYVGAGTVEFIADGAQGLRPDRFWFMEMNTRLQVEHPVTEAITGLDLVDWQFKVAAGESLPLAQDAITFSGHAFEARLYAEDPDKNFLPSTGRLAVLELPNAGVRVDTGVVQGSDISPYYDPMIAKLIVHGATRDEALDRMGAALDDTFVAGVRNNAAFLRTLVSHPAFRAGDFDTGFIDRHVDELLAVDPASESRVIASAVHALVNDEQARLASRTGAAGGGWGDPWSATDGFGLGAPRELTLHVSVDGHKRAVGVKWRAGGHDVDGVAEAATDVRLVRTPTGVIARLGVLQREVAMPRYDLLDLDHLDNGGLVTAPMTGKVIAILVESGAAVEKGQRVAILEAMKMEHVLQAPVRGTVTGISAAVGDQVGAGAAIVVVEPAEEEAA